MHRESRSAACGFSRDNHIGTSPQPNTPMENWIDFFRVRRLGFQAKMAQGNGLADPLISGLMEKLMMNLEQYLIPCDQNTASLLHGDLWAGNFLTGPEGQAWIVDPAVYYGHREADLAMTELFGGYDSRFYHAYREEWPLEPGYSRRRDLYNLYHLLNHLNLFGRTYAPGILSTLRHYTG